MQNTDWIKLSLQDLCDIIPGYAFKSKDFNFGSNVAIKIKDINSEGICVSSADTVAFTPSDKFKLSEGDFAMAMTGATIGKVGRLNSKRDNVYINQRVCKFIPKGSICDKDYLYYILSTNSFKHFIYNNVDSKLAQPNIGHPTLYKYSVSVPHEIEEQKLIASVLKNLDRKIELNRQINDNLPLLDHSLRGAEIRRAA